MKKQNQTDGMLSALSREKGIQSMRNPKWLATIQMELDENNLSVLRDLWNYWIESSFLFFVRVGEFSRKITKTCELYLEVLSRSLPGGIIQDNKKCTRDSKSYRKMACRMVAAVRNLRQDKGTKGHKTQCILAETWKRMDNTERAMKNWLTHEVLKQILKMQHLWNTKSAMHTMEF